MYPLPDFDNPSITWLSDNPSIISIQDGIITANEKGSAVISANIGSLSDSTNITVFIVADSFDLNPTEEWIIAKDVIQLSISNIRPTDAETNITWAISSSLIANVDSTGLVTTKKPGDVIVYANSDTGLRRESILHICYPVTAIDFAQEEATIIPFEDYQLTANVTMRTQNCINHLVSFSSSNPEVATVSEQGIVHGIQAGTTTITAEAASGVTASIDITVREANILQFPTGLTEIEAEAFAETACEVVIVPTSCNSIGEHAFYNCKKLKIVKIPAHTTVAPNAFEECENVVVERVTE